MMQPYLLCCYIVLLSSFNNIKAEPVIIVDAVALLQAPTGNEAQILHQLLAAYPAQYSITDISRNRAREWVKTAENACIPWLKKTAAREQDFLFSLPYMVEDALQLVVPADSRWHSTLQTLQQHNPQISLLQILSLKPGPVIGIEINRSYGETLDRLLSQRQSSWSIYTRTTSSNETGSMLPMLQRGFIDATLEYRKVAQRTDSSLHFYSLLEAEPVNLVHFACSKGERGQQVVNLLNQVILSKSQQPDYQQLVLQGIKGANQQLALQIWLKALTTVP
ncbi:MAG: hypothetical protein KKE30_08135 [Gammaproteobacteria bacterium]|nr:hypothetical protein [Gammaproteobacteria bacterium]MBU2071512.1 hypothetical protein [Gammaproteobacteria bacterium]MBU2184003.1 hypothetical protein [Gammaproteobacteria bacterium]MBU2206911.1 hypothetical protein [Gammaproteobacteria bacterium]